MSTIAPNQLKTISAATGDVLTVDSTTNIWPGTFGWLVKGGQTTLRVRVTAVPSSTTLRVVPAPKIGDANFAKGTAPVAYPSNMAGGDLSAYNGGTISIEEQSAPTLPDGSKVFTA